MIGYMVSRANLEQLVKEASATWMKRAAGRTSKFRKLRKFQESGSIWSEVKPVYMKLQGGSKCAFCERKLESVDYGTGEQDVEHFRPKAAIRTWPLPASLAGSVKPVKAPARGGYHLLAYDLLNYTASCKPCNSALKGNYFPLAGKYKLTGRHPEELTSENPLLIYPIGDFDADPEDLIRFNGASPYAVAQSGYDRQRALVTIEFFQLDRPERKNLIRERALVLTALFPALETLVKSGGTDAQASKVVRSCTSATAPHANCARSFRDLHARQRSAAQALFESAAELLASSS